jgi:hypothetical protein
MAPKSKPFDIYEVPDSDEEKSMATKIASPSARTRRSHTPTRVKYKTNGNKDLQRVSEHDQSKHNIPIQRKLKRLGVKRKQKGAELVKLRRSARLEAKGQKML